MTETSDSEVERLREKLRVVEGMCHETGRFNYWREKPVPWRNPRELAVDILAVIKEVEV